MWGSDNTLVILIYGGPQKYLDTWCLKCMNLIASDDIL